MIELSPDQREVYNSIIRWSGSGNGLLTVGGFAGSGKSTLLGVFAAQQKSLTAYATYTGRASSVLQRKLAEAGVSTTQETRTKRDARVLGRSGGQPLCTTIHGLLYRPIIDEATEECHGYERREELDRDYKLIVVDEGSMISDEILRTVQGHGKPLLVVGDHGQLPPVMAKGDLMRNPMLRLEKIHRQAEDNPIIALSKHVREGGRIVDYRGPMYDAIRFEPKSKAPEVMREAYELAESPLDVGVLCWTNRARVTLNRKAREVLGRGSQTPRRGEVVICLRNDPPVYNGMRGLLVEDAILDQERSWLLYAKVLFPDEGIEEGSKCMCSMQFNREKTFSSLEEMTAEKIPAKRMSDAGLLYDWGYALTTHKSQGSQFDHVILFCDRKENPADEEARRYYYTAITRAVSRLTILV